jgi:hypothetical protein
VFRPQVDVYKLTIDAGTNLRVAALAAPVSASMGGEPFEGPLDGYLRLFDADGRELLANDDAEGQDPALRALFPTAGTYFVGLSSHGNEQYNPNDTQGPGTTSGPYAIVFEVAPHGDTIATAATVLLSSPSGDAGPSTITDQLAADGDVAVYRVSLAAGDLLAAGLAVAVPVSEDPSAPAAVTLTPEVELLDSAGRPVALAPPSTSGTTGQKVYAPTAGVYYVRVGVGLPSDPFRRTSDPFGTRPFALTLGRGAFEPDGNDTLETATPLDPAKSSIEGEIEHATDVDLYAIDLTAGDRLVLGTSMFAFEGTLAGRVRVFNSAGQELTLDRVPTNSIDPGIAPSDRAFTVPASGRYYVGVSSSSFQIDAASLDYDPTVPFSGRAPTFSLGDYELSYQVDSGSLPIIPLPDPIVPVPVPLPGKIPGEPGSGTPVTVPGGEESSGGIPIRGSDAGTGQVRLAATDRGGFGPDAMATPQPPARFGTPGGSAPDLSLDDYRARLDRAAAHPPDPAQRQLVDPGSSEETSFGLILPDDGERSGEPPVPVVGRVPAAAAESGDDIPPAAVFGVDPRDVTIPPPPDGDPVPDAPGPEPSALWLLICLPILVAGRTPRRRAPRPSGALGVDESDEGGCGVSPTRQRGQTWTLAGASG